MKIGVINQLVLFNPFQFSITHPRRPKVAILKVVIGTFSASCKTRTCDLVVMSDLL